MCGFAAFFEKDHHFRDNFLNDVELDIYHRGPDSGGRFTEADAAIVFRRLAIVDLDKRSDQPLFSACARFVIAFNGEIYNFKEIRSDLEAKGRTFRTYSDTEVIVEGFAHFGEEIFNKLNGMFAIVIFDRKEKKATLARDPFGIKPLYIYRNGQQLAVSSEMRPIRRFMNRTEVDESSLAELIFYRHTAGVKSNLKGIDMLAGGEVMRFDIMSGNVQKTSFCDPLDLLQNKSGEDQTSEEATLEVEDLLRSSVTSQLMGDVGVSVQLSGGVDSSLVLALGCVASQTKMASYAVQFDDPKFDEGDHRRRVVEAYDPTHHEIKLGSEDYFNGLSRAVSYLEGPSAHGGCVMLMHLCGVISRRNKVVLTGEGADELFGGYARYGIWRQIQRHVRFSGLVPNWMWPLLSRYIFLKRYVDFEPASISSSLFDLERLGSIFPEIIPNDDFRRTTSARFQDFRDKLTASDITSYLPSLLLRQDKLSMSHSLEARVPFLDKNLAKFVLNLPIKKRIPEGDSKLLLKKIAVKYVDKSVVYRKKVGLSMPYSHWLNEPAARPALELVFNDPNARLLSYCRREDLLNLMSDDWRIHPRNALLVNHLLNLEYWLRSLEHFSPPGRPLVHKVKLSERQLIKPLGV